MPFVLISYGFSYSGFFCELYIVFEKYYNVINQNRRSRIKQERLLFLLFLFLIVEQISETSGNVVHLSLFSRIISAIINVKSCQEVIVQWCINYIVCVHFLFFKKLDKLEILWYKEKDYLSYFVKITFCDKQLASYIVCYNCYACWLWILRQIILL